MFPVHTTKLKIIKDGLEYFFSIILFINGTENFSPGSVCLRVNIAMHYVVTKMYVY